MIFRPKKKRPILDGGRLAQAITIYSDKINLENLQGSVILGEKIRLDENLTIMVDTVSRRDDQCFVGLFCHHFNSCSLNVSTYINGIAINRYLFELDLSESHELYRDWYTKESENYHEMPSQFIQKMNNWSYQTVMDFHAKIGETTNEDNKKKEQYEKEEGILQMYQ